MMKIFQVDLEMVVGSSVAVTFFVQQNGIDIGMPHKESICLLPSSLCSVCHLSMTIFRFYLSTCV